MTEATREIVGGGIVRAAIYCRLSKNRRGKKANVKDQEHDCRAHIEAQGWQHVDSYIDDGISASDKSEKPRDGFNRMMADLRAGLIDVIVASEFTRLYRRPRELEELLDPIDKFRYNVDLITIDPTVREWDIRSGVGRAQLREAAKQAAEYSDYISEKVRAHAKHRAEKGLWHGGHPGYGFEYAPVVRDGEGEELEPEQITINEEQATIIRRQVVWQLLSGMRFQTVCERLNHQEIWTREGRRWRQGNLHPIVVKPAIAGLVKHPEKPEHVRARWGTFVECLQHPDSDRGCYGAIVSECDWRKLQAILARPERRTNLVGKRTALLTGFVYCGNPECGKRLTATRDGRGKRSYVCQPTTHQRGCGTIRRLADPIDQLVTELIIATLEGADDFTIPIPEGDDFAALYADKRALEQQQEQLAIDHYRLKVIGRVPYLAANEALETDIAAIQRKLDRATTHRHVKELPVGEIAKAEWDAHADDLAWRRELVGLLIEKVIVKPNPAKYVRHHPHFGARFDPDAIEVVPRKLRSAPAEVPNGRAP
jgi:DNA invertase Pin-like site-specific DNA recombinase